MLDVGAKVLEVGGDEIAGVVEVGVLWMGFEMVWFVFGIYLFDGFWVLELFVFIVEVGWLLQSVFGALGRVLDGCLVRE